MTHSNFQSLIIAPKTTMKEAIVQLNETGKKALFVADPSGRLLGSITDGDIRRAIIRGKEFSTPVASIMCSTPQSLNANQKDYRAKAKQLMLDFDVEHIPIVDERGSILEILNWQNLFSDKKGIPLTKPLSNPVVIMAGGKGTRLDPLTKILPKPLIPLGEKPIIEIIMDNFRARGFSHFTMTLNYKKELIKAFFSENDSEINLHFAEEPDFLGTAGSLFLLKDKIHETFYVTNCDIILEAEFEKVLEWHQREKAVMTLIGSHKEMHIPYGLIECNGEGFKAIKEKPVLDLVINSGVYICEPAIFSLIKDGEFLNMNELIERASQAGKVSVFPIYEGWFDAGQFKEYQDTLRKIEEYL